MSCKCARKCMICYVNYPIFPGDDTHGTPSRTYPHIGDAPVGQDADHLLVTPMLNTNRPHAFNHWCIVPPSASEHFWLLALSLEHFTVRSDVGAIHGNLLRRRRLKTYLLTQLYSAKRTHCLVFYCFTVLFTVLQWYLQYSCSVTF